MDNRALHWSQRLQHIAVGLRSTGQHTAIDDAIDLDGAARELRRLHTLINNPHTADFIEAVKSEAAFQREHWAASHDAGKTDADWFWLVGYLAGKALSKPEKLLHHVITTAAACLNWHMARTVGTDMRPGTAQPSLPETVPGESK